MPGPGEKLRALIEAGEHFVCGDVFSAITGRIVEHVGFPAAYLGGHACSAFHYAVPDNGVYSQVEQIEQAARIAQVMTIPLIADADTLGETVADAYHFTRRYIQQGIAGIHVEDERNPKHSKHVNGLCSIEDQQARIDAARRAQRDSGQDFVIIARCDELYTSEMGGGGTGSMDEAVKRGHAYMEAGADVVFYPPRPNWVADLVEAFGAKIPVATMGFSLPGTAFNMATGGWVTAAANHLKLMRELKEEGRMLSGNFDFPEKYDLIDQPLYDGLIEEWAEKTGRPTRPNHAP
ncbi:isocitrate lyase/PEP mutase family protein [Novosphingobium beihaiensis]|uniref:Isocitrate lyase/PEP mutase family protein n=1 Tax=Novosphingobium beihaiensis TaxID=2930389 RepID=A0ABT0BLH7_9SPHN|nr:isocitrate lyase/PEP mutase family protein [Novosphingobium beihaiensis]MCJ2185921.1 isocitrate lyase/PEP mutase family protein [Novosphingobium beihaiensis]